MSRYAQVLLPGLPLDQTFLYTVPIGQESRAKPGVRVIVPFGRRQLTGFIVGVKKRNPAPRFKLKPIIQVLDEIPIFSTPFLSFTKKLSRHYYSSWGKLLEVSLPSSFLIRSQRRVIITEKGKQILSKKNLSQTEAKLLRLVANKKYTPHFLRKKLKIANISFLLSQLEKKGFIQIQESLKTRRRKKGGISSPRQTQLEIDFFEDEFSQQTASNLAGHIGKSLFSPFLLLAPPEKREKIYFYLIKKTLGLGKKALILFPEISITKSMITKFERKIGASIACLHSQLTERQKEIEWKRIKKGEVGLVVGPRSALFSPLQELALIIVDEEHDESYYQQETPVYDARQGAWLRAKEENSLLIYGSLSPSVETFYRAKKKGYLLLGEDSFNQPEIEIISFSKERRIISTKVKEKIKERLKKGQPILVFLNRRGYASFLFCPSCGYIPRCPQCNVSLTYHKKEKKLICHYCDFSLPKADVCPDCGRRIIMMKSFGTEAVEEELREMFPRSRIVCFDTDRIKSKREEEKITYLFSKGKIDILIGTKLLAHQRNMRPASLVIILYPEIQLSLSDFKASQKTFQTIRQMIGLTAEEKGEVIIQTGLPSHFSLRAAANMDYLSFYKQEIEYRRLMNYPPFTVMAELWLQGKNLRTLARKSREITDRIENLSNNIEILGPAIVRSGSYRRRKGIQWILKTNKRKELETFLKEIFLKIAAKKSILIYD